MFLNAMLLIFFCCGLAAAFECDPDKDSCLGALRQEAEGTVLFQSATSMSATLLKDPILDMSGALGEDSLDIEAAMQEDDATVTSAECKHEAAVKPLKSEEMAPQQQTVAAPEMPLPCRLDGIFDYLSLFQDFVWFGIAFVALCIWHCFNDAAKTAEKLSEPKVIEEAAAPRSSANTSMKVDALVKAMYSANKDDLRKFLEERSVNARDEVCCCTALHIAAHYSCLPAAEALLTRGADANVCDVWDETPLHFAARAGNEEVCALLLKSGANTNASNMDGYTPLVVAAQAQKEAVCELLLDHGAHVGGMDEEEVPPFLSSVLMCRILAGR